MKATLPFFIIAAFIMTASCNSRQDSMEADESAATMASETGTDAALPADVIYTTRPLISGEVYKTASFQGHSLIHFDTTQVIQVLDTADAVFVRARVKKDTAAYTGFVSKAILPE